MLANRTEPMQEQTWWKLHCASWLLVFCAVAWCCWCWLWSEWWKTTSKPIHILTALFTTGIHKEYKQVLPYRPTSWKPWPTSSTVRDSVTTFENSRGEKKVRANYWLEGCDIQSHGFCMCCIIVWSLYCTGCRQCSTVLHTHATLHIYHMFIFYLHMLFAYSICCLGS